MHIHHAYKSTGTPCITHQTCFVQHATTHAVAARHLLLMALTASPSPLLVQQGSSSDHSTPVTLPPPAIHQAPAVHLVQPTHVGLTLRNPSPSHPHSHLAMYTWGCAPAHPAKSSTDLWTTTPTAAAAAPGSAVAAVQGASGAVYLARWRAAWAQQLVKHLAKHTRVLRAANVNPVEQNRGAVGAGGTQQQEVGSQYVIPELCTRSLGPSAPPPWSLTRR